MSEPKNPTANDLSLARVEVTEAMRGPYAPDATQVRVANGFLPVVIYGSLFDLTAFTNQVGVKPDGDIYIQNSIACRIRFDLELATKLRDALTGAIESLKVPEGIKPS